VRPRAFAVKGFIFSKMFHECHNMFHGWWPLCRGHRILDSVIPGKRHRHQSKNSGQGDREQKQHPGFARSSLRINAVPNATNVRGSKGAAQCRRTIRKT